jgi:hypothetical protein
MRCLFLCLFGILWATPKETIEEIAHNLDVAKQEASRLALKLFEE